MSMRARIVRIRSIKFNGEKLSTHSTVQLAAAAAAHMCATHKTSCYPIHVFSVTFAIFFSSLLVLIAGNAAATASLA